MINNDFTIYSYLSMVSSYLHPVLLFKIDI
jgi:hypothetical protein